MQDLVPVKLPVMNVDHFIEKLEEVQDEIRDKIS